MPVNFFDSYHTQSNQEYFGLCDDADPAKNPARIKEDEPEKWIGIVHNMYKITAHFYGIDNDVAVRVYKAPPNETDWESSCDGMLYHGNKLFFIELKQRQGSGWLGKATDQLINTVKLFSQQKSLDSFDDIKAYICNSMRPRSNGNHMKEIQRFYDETVTLNFKGAGVGLEMDVKRELNV